MHAAVYFLTRPTLIHSTRVDFYVPILSLYGFVTLHPPPLFFFFLLRFGSGNTLEQVDLERVWEEGDFFLSNLTRTPPEKMLISTEIKS